MGYTRHAFRGVSWIGALRLSTRLIALLKNIIFARLLLPEQFGQVGIAMLVLALVEILTDTGINVFLLQEKNNINKYINTAWVVSMGRGLIIFLVLLIASPFVALFFNSPESVWLLVLISFVPLIRGLINPSIIKLMKDLQFGKEFWLRLTIFSFDAIVAIYLTAITGNPSGLIYGMLAGAILEVAISFVFCNPRPRFSMNKLYVKEIINRGKWVTGAGVFEYIFREGDDIVVGRLLGAGPLGLYQMAYKIATLPITEVADVISKVTLPVYVKISDDKRRLKKAYLKITLSSVVLAFPVAFVVFVFAEQILLILLGPQWVSASGAMRAVAVYAVIRAGISPVLTALTAVKHQKAVTTITFVSIAGMFIFIIPLVNMYGITGAGVSTIVGSLISLPFVIFYSRKYLLKG